MASKRLLGGVAALTTFVVLAGSAYAAGADRSTAIEENLKNIKSAYSSGDKAALNSELDAFKANLDAALVAKGEATSTSTTAASAATSTSASANEANALFVAVTGNDDAAGTKTSPFGTLAKAQSVAAAGTKKVIFVRGGTYKLSAPVALGSADSGVTWVGYPGEQATIDSAGKDAFQLKGTSSVSIENLSFTNVGRGVALLDTAVDTKVLWNNFQNCALNCVAINYFSKNSVVTNNTMIGGGTGVGDEYGRPLGTYHSAIYLGFSSTGNNISRNAISDYGSVGITIADGSGQEVSSNNTIDRNVIKNVSTKLHDSGGIYVLDRGQSATGNVISNNYIDGVGFDMNKAIYLDDGASNISVTGNACRNCGQYAIQYHGGKNLTVENNVFDISNSSKIGYYQSYAGGSTAPGLMTDNSFKNNTVYSSKVFPAALWDFDNNYAGTTVAIVNPAVGQNRYFSPSGAPQNLGPIVDSSPVVGTAGAANAVTAEGKGPLPLPASLPAR